MKYLFALAAAALAVSPAVAGSDLPTAVVNYGDLDLATEKGQTRLTRRIEAAARSVCRQSVRTGTHIMKPTNCYENAVRGAKRELAARAGGAVVASR